MQVTVSLLIPCFNSAAQLPRLFQGVRAQTKPFDEIICYDDCSSDNTTEIAASLGATVIRGTRRRGVAHARNCLLNAASCEWVHFHDSDDLIRPEYVSTMSGYCLSKNTVVVCNQENADSECNVRDVVNHSSMMEEDVIKYLLAHLVHLNSVLFPRAALSKIGGLDERLRVCCEDQDIMLRVAMLGCPIVHVNKTLTTWIHHPRSTMQTSKKNAIWRCFLLFHIRCFRILDKRYHSIIGEQVAELGWCFYFADSHRSADICISLAKRCGIFGLGRTGSFRWRVSRLLGFRSFFYLRKWYALARIRRSKRRAD